jgi:AcrR family transcriptional regulator
MGQLVPGVSRAATRNRLLAAGLELFGRDGFDAVTTRQIADAAGVNQAAIPYHFGGKEGVYRAVTDHIATVTAAQV